MPRLKLRSRQWIVDERGRIIMGEGRREILENIHRTGSINQAAKIMRMSYKGVWSKIRATETYLNARIVQTDRREGSRLTRTGLELLEKYKQLKTRCLQEEHRIFDAVFPGGRYREEGSEE